jgi:MtN3 and saliva related transmembrane protein
MDITTVVGTLASVFTALSLIPQLVKLCKEKEPENISMGMLGILCAGLALWILYGVMRDDWIIIISNSFSLLVNITIITLALRYQKRK